MRLNTLWGKLELRRPRTASEKSVVSLFLCEAEVERSLRQALVWDAQGASDLLDWGARRQIGTLSWQEPVIAALIDQLRWGRLVLASDGDGSDAETNDPSWEAYEAFGAAFGRQFMIDTREYRLVSSDRAAELRREADYDVVPVEEARSIVLGLAKARKPGPLQAHCERLVNSLVDLRGAGNQGGFVLLRLPIAQAARYVPEEEIITPGKLKKLKEGVWIELVIETTAGRPWVGPYRLELSDGSVVEGRTNGEGITLVEGIAPGSATLVLPSLHVKAVRKSD